MITRVGSDVYEFTFDMMEWKLIEENRDGKEAVEVYFYYVFWLPCSTLKTFLRPNGFCAHVQFAMFVILHIYEIIRYWGSRGRRVLYTRKQSICITQVPFLGPR